MAVTPDEMIRAQYNADVMAHHHAVRDGSVWLCMHCRRVLGEFGDGMPVTVADCVPRRWGDGAPV